METKKLISDLMDFKLDGSVVTVSLNGEELDANSVKEEDFMYNYRSVIHVDMENYELVDKDELEELREQAGITEELEEEVIHLQELVDSLQEQISEM